ncbi:MAG: methylenetetrahydrofolate--tRNA-(uracil(54)-C(5))-methyltransferase (FADH(2)-oxidizing) TrmFO [Clostridiales bacterium]|nr:methylenetetrahydrofolate--tRNA-(uracil(54)-C(5))-methyltransferase (FADH(2)-oxidizing) TrmFO [Clostridiales bacterium]
MKTVNVIGLGLAGVEATYQLAKRGILVDAYEMKPTKFSPAHESPNFAEIVCSNSFKSDDPSTASGCLKAEMREFDSLVLRCAEKSKVPAGSALAVDRDKFSELVTEEIKKLKGVTIHNEEVTKIDLTKPTIIATGPLTSDDLSKELQKLLGEDNLHFYDASAPIIDGETIDKTKSFTAGRYGKGESDYINLPMNKEEYYAFIDALVNAERTEMHSFEKKEIFEGCMPVEVMASRGVDTLRFGPLRPVGLRLEDGTKPFAVVQLRKESTENELYNLVGFQTNLKWGEQKRVFSMIPALKDADFIKYGVMHRNSFICAPKHLNHDFSLRSNPNIYIAGQLSGVEGYMESTASGMIAGISLALKINGQTLENLPKTTIIGAITNYLVTAEPNGFQPMNANFGILPPLAERIKDKALKKLEYSKRALSDLKQYKENNNVIF